MCISDWSSDVCSSDLYCIQWMTAETLDRRRPTTFFAAPTADDIEREQRVLAFVREHLADWQARGFVPDMVIEPGAKTDDPNRTRGWTHWTPLFKLGRAAGREKQGRYG